MSYSPNHYSEKLLAGPPYLGCRVSSDAIATDIATLGESSRRDDGRTKLKRARKVDLQRGWRAFAKQTPADSNGIPDQGDVRLIHAAMYDLPSPILVQTRDFSEVWDAIGEYAVSLALRLRDAPANSSLRRWTSADHQMVLYRKRNGEARVMDPMAPHSLTYTGVWADRGDIRAAAGAIENGTYIAELYPAGEWTRETLMRKKKNRRIERIEESAARTETELRARIIDLEATVPPDCADEVRNAKAAGRESAFVQVLQGVQAMRTTEGP